jgi:uncharacterized protein
VVPRADESYSNPWVQHWRNTLTSALVALHNDIELAARKLHVLHAVRLACKRGCSGCCVEGISVFGIEADRIRQAYPELLLLGAPHALGACAFLDAEGGCRIYEERPYVCRTQGLPLRWIEDDRELRDICPMNEVPEHSSQTALEELPEDACWTLGPTEAKLAALDLAQNRSGSRTLLRSLFANEASPDLPERA